MKVKRLVTEAMLCALALILSYVESLFPLSVAVPGVKMGLPNLVIVFALYRMGAGSAARISLVRVAVVALLFGNIYSLLYSLAGAVLSLVLMALLKNVSGLHTAGVSVAGAVMHNIAQIGVAMIILGTKEIIYYLPPLLISGVVTGVAIGLVAALLIQRIPEKMTSFWEQIPPSSEYPEKSGLFCRTEEPSPLSASQNVVFLLGTRSSVCLVKFLNELLSLPLFQKINKAICADKVFTKLVINKRFSLIKTKHVFPSTR